MSPSASIADRLVERGRTSDRSRLALELEINELRARSNHVQRTDAIDGGDVVDAGADTRLDVCTLSLSLSLPLI